MRVHVRACVRACVVCVRACVEREEMVFAKHSHLVERLNEVYITQLTSTCMYLELTKSIIIVVQFFQIDSVSVL